MLLRAPANIHCQDQEYVHLDIHSSIYLHGLVLNQLSTQASLPYRINLEKIMLHEPLYGIDNSSMPR
jgi:hypothetical protein